jgi:hypothetical protein
MSVPASIRQHWYMAIVQPLKKLHSSDYEVYRFCLCFRVYKFVRTEPVCVFGACLVLMAWLRANVVTCSLVLLAAVAAAVPNASLTTVPAKGNKFAVQARPIPTVRGGALRPRESYHLARKAFHFSTIYAFAASFRCAVFEIVNCCQ